MQKPYLCVAVGLAIFLQSPTTFAADTCAGIIDPSFRPPKAAGPILIDGDGMLMWQYSSLARLRADGSYDPSFTVFVSSGQSSSGQSSTFVRSVVKAGTGAWLVGGSFGFINTVLRTNLARVLSNGEVDLSFSVSSPILPVLEMALDSTGRIIVATGADAAGKYSVIRLSANGAVDPFFKLDRMDSPASAIAVQSDGSVLVGGRFTLIDGTLRAGFARILADGTLDENFAPALPFKTLSGIKLVSDNKILVFSTGNYSSDGEQEILIARLLPDWTIDQTFNPTLRGMVHDAAIQSDGRIIVGGFFPEEPAGLQGIKRLLTNGAIDPTFNPALSASTPYSAGNVSVSIVRLDAQERVLIVGAFGDVNGIYRPGVARLFNDNSPCPAIISLETGDYLFTEGGAAEIALLRSGDLTTRVSANLMVNSSHWPINETLSELFETNVVFEPGVTRVVLTGTLTNDGVLNPGASASAMLYNPSSNAILGAIQYARIGIMEGSWLNQPGSIDLIFQPKINGEILDVKVLPDQKILIAGKFTKVNGQEIRGMARLNADGTTDSTFDFEMPGVVPHLITLWGNKIYISPEEGDAVVRLNSNGSRDETFQPVKVGVHTHWRQVSGLEAQEDGKVVIVGDFTIVNGVRRPSVARINADGTLDTSFKEGAVLGVETYSYRSYPRLEAAHILDDNSVLVTGHFNRYGTNARPFMAHLSASNDLLDDFIYHDVYSELYVGQDILEKPDGSILLAGSFLGKGPLTRFSADGVLDQSFHTGFGQFGTIQQVVFQPDGKMIVIGSDGISPGYIKRLNPDGSFDETFRSGQGGGMDGNIALTASGDLLVAGNFQTFNGAPQAYLARVRTGGYSGAGAVGFVDRYVNVAPSDGVATVKLQRSIETNVVAQVRVYTLDYQSAKAGIDYTPIDQTVTFAPGEIEKQVAIQIMANSARTSTIYLGVKAEPLTPGLAVLPEGMAAVHISPEPRAGGFSFWTEGGNTQAHEGGNGTIIVTSPGDTGGPATVELVAEAITAAPGVDFGLPEKQVLTFVPGEYSKIMFFPVFENNVPQLNRTFRLKLQNPTGGALATPSTVEITIIDGATQFYFTKTNLIATQYDRSVWAPISLKERPSGYPLRISYKTSGGTAQPGVEYIPQEGFFDFDSSSWEGLGITIPLLPNEISGDPTTIEVTLKVEAGEAFITGGPAIITLRHPPHVSPAGSLDSSFSPLPARTNASISSVVAAGDYVYVMGKPDGVSSALRLTADGAVDSSFAPALADAALFPQADGKLLAAQTFSTLADGFLGREYARLNFDGSIDLSFDAELPEAAVVSFTQQADGKVLAFGGLYVLDGPTYLARLLPDGTMDSSFPPIAISREMVPPVMLIFPPRTSRGMVQDDSGRIVVSGAFDMVQGHPRKNMARFLRNGTFDPTFTLSSDVWGVYAMKPAPGGKIIALVIKTSAMYSQARYTLVRINANGSLDSTFQPPFAPRDFVGLFDVDAQGRSYVSHQRENSPGPALFLRLRDDGSIDPDFTTQSTASAAFVTPQGLYVVRHQQNPDPSAPLLTRMFMDPPPAIFKTPRVTAEGKLVLQFNFPSNLPYLIETTSDFQTWTEIASGTTAAGASTFEGEAAVVPQFFRLRERP